MRILALDTSGPSASVALTQDGVCLFECTLQNGLTHSQSLMPLVEQAFETAGFVPKDADLFACVVGPGSFTGVRIGVGTVKALSQALGKPCVGVDALEAFAAGIEGFPGVICPIQDARAGQVYGAAFRAGEVPVRLLLDMAEMLPVYLAQVKALGGPFLFTGDGVAKHEAAIRAELCDLASFAPMHARVLRASAVAYLTEKRFADAVSYDQLLPLYLRAPQAERERLAREAPHG